MSAYGINLNIYTHCLQLESGKEMNRGHILYIDGRAYTHKNIVEFINSSRGMYPIVRPNCQFVEVINDRDGDMEREVDRLIMVEAIMDLTTGDELLIDYPFLKHTLVRKKREEQGLPKDVRKGRKPKNNE
jgi:sugar-specific transcriptional regulator TrmB